MEYSYFWNSAPLAGDGRPITQEDWRQILYHLGGGASLAEGGVVMRGDGDLLPHLSGDLRTVRIGRGAANVLGVVYLNDSEFGLVPTPYQAGATGGSLVLRVDWQARTVKAALTLNNAGNPAPPALTQTVGNVYEQRLADFTVNPDGTVSNLIDRRKFMRAHGTLNVPQMDFGAGTIPYHTNHLGEDAANLLAAWNGSSIGVSWPADTPLIEQGGVMNAPQGAWPVYGGYRVTFARPFLYPPLVEIEIVTALDITMGNAGIYIASISAASFTVRTTDSSGFAGNIDIHWHAYGIGVAE